MQMTTLVLAALVGTPGRPSLDLQELVDEAKASAKLISLGAAVQLGSDKWIAVAGERKLGSGVLVQPTDVWHIGSNSKSWTATLAGILVDEGRLKWSSKVGSVLKDLAGSPLGEATIWDLLTHTSGLPNISYPGSVNWWKRTEPIRTQRADYANHLKSVKLGSREFRYSNANYVLAGAVLEQITGKAWEELVLMKIAKPLGIKSIGFGAAGTDDKIDQPWPHLILGDKTIAVSPQGRMDIVPDNAPVLYPAGGIHISLEDMLTYLRSHNGRGKQLVQAATRKFLHTPADKGYAGGWGTVRYPWTKSLVINHGGSNTMNLHVVWASSNPDFVMVLATNQSGPKDYAAFSELSKKVMKGLGL